MTVRRTVPGAKRPDVLVRFVTAPDLEESYPQPVDKSETPSIIIELDAGDDLNTAAAELNITPDELNRQINSGTVKIVCPVMDIPIHQQPKPGPVQVWWSFER